MSQIFLQDCSLWFLVWMNFKIIYFHWFGKGGKIGSMSPHPWFLLLNIKYDNRTVKAEIFCLNFLNLMLLWQNLWSFLQYSLFSKDIWEPISNGMMLTDWPPISEIRCWYFWYFMLCEILIRDSEGTMSSKMLTSLFFWS